MSTISRVVLPVKDPTTGVITNVEFELSGGGLPTSVTNPQDGQLLKYDASQGAWVNVVFTTNTPTAVSVSGEKLTVTAGTAASISSPT